MIRMASFTGRLRGNRGQHAAASLRDPRRLPAGPAAGDGDLDTREREIIAAHQACQTARNGTGAQCTCGFRCANFWLREARQGRPSWTPARNPPPPFALTAPMPVAPTRGISPLDNGTPVWPASRPVIGDALAAAFPPPPPPAPPVPACDPLPYTQPGWAGLQMRRWIESGEWEPADAAVPAGYEQNAADMGVQLVRYRAGIVKALTLGCADLGCAGLAPVLWERANELARAARAAAAAGGAR